MPTKYDDDEGLSALQVSSHGSRPDPLSVPEARDGEAHDEEMISHHGIAVDTRSGRLWWCHEMTACTCACQRLPVLHPLFGTGFIRRNVSGSAWYGFVDLECFDGRRCRRGPWIYGCARHGGCAIRRERETKTMRELCYRTGPPQPSPFLIT